MASTVVKPPLWIPGRNPEAMDLWRDCIGYWPMWEGVGSSTVDLGPYGSNAARAGDVAWYTDVYGPCVYLDGTGDDLAVDAAHQTPYLFGSADSWSLMCVFQSHAIATQQDLFRVDEGGANRDLWLLRIDSSALQLFFGDTGGTTESQVGGTTLSSNVWYVAHAVVDVDRDHVWVYLNGADDGNSADGSTAWSTTASPLHLGSYRTTGEYFGGFYALAVIWKRALSAGEVRQTAADPFIMIRPPELLPIFASAFSPAAAAGNPWYYYAQLG